MIMKTAPNAIFLLMKNQSQGLKNWTRPLTRGQVKLSRNNLAESHLIQKNP